MVREDWYRCPRCGGHGELTTAIRRADGSVGRRYVCKACHMPFQTHEGPVIGGGRNWFRDELGEWHRVGTR